MGDKSNVVALLGYWQGCKRENAIGGLGGKVGLGISATAVAQLQNITYELITGVGWTQNCIIVEKCKNLEQVTFYLKQTKEKVVGC